MLEKRLRYWSGWPWLIGIGGSLLLAQLITYVRAEWLWFQDAGYSNALALRLWAQVLLGGGAVLLSGLVLWGNLALAQRSPSPSMTRQSLAEPEQSRQTGIGLFPLLTLTSGLALVLGIQMLYLGRVIISYWDLNALVYNASPPLPLWAKPAAIGTVFTQLITHPWQLVTLGVVAIAFLFLPQICTAIAATFVSFSLGIALAEQWTKVLKALRPVAFDAVDPLFGQDISYYVFQLPFLEVLEFWFISLIFFTLVSVTLVYLLSGNSLSNGRFPGFTPQQQRHLYALGGLLLLATSLNHWLGRFEILYSPQGVVYGASYTDVQVGLPVYTGLSAISLLLGVSMLWRALFWAIGVRDLMAWLGKIGHRRYAAMPPFSQRPLTARPLIWGLAVYVVLAVIGGLLVPRLVQQVVVQPNELQRERPYIERAIAQTRQAFDLADINVQPFDPQGDLAATALD
ncbi:MAG: UPF0182 family protein, partial [Cyanobacteria bacterium P01_D01_bin.71]